LDFCLSCKPMMLAGKWKERKRRSPGRIRPGLREAKCWLLVA
jgi:hypothetical protein